MKQEENLLMEEAREMMKNYRKKEKQEEERGRGEKKEKQKQKRLEICRLMDELQEEYGSSWVFLPNKHPKIAEIHAIVKEMGIWEVKRSSFSFSEGEDNFLRRNFDGYTDEYLADALGLHVDVVRERRKELGLEKTRKRRIGVEAKRGNSYNWKRNDRERVKEMYLKEGFTQEEIAKHFGVTKSAINNLLSRMRKSGEVDY